MSFAKKILVNRITRKLFFLLRYYGKKDSLFKIHHDFTQNKGFDCRNFDQRIAHYVDKKYSSQTFEKKPCEESHIAFLATELYDMGGHTEVLKNLVSLLAEVYTITTFLVRKTKTYTLAPKKIKDIEKYSNIEGINPTFACKLQDVKKLFLQIVESNPKVLFVFTHMDDVIGAAVLHLIKKHTDIKIIYWNHGSHFPALGFSFADLVLEGAPSMHYVTKNYRGVDKCHVLGLVDVKKEDIHYYSEQERAQKRKELGIAENELFTLSGADKYKFFDGQDSPYFRMIRILLEQEPLLQHRVIAILNEEQKNIVESIFKNSTARDRLQFLDYTTDYPRIFQCCDVFIDSFPVSSALAQVELMKWKKATVVKINRENALLSFHEYFPKNYAYMFETVEEMTQGIRKLLHSKEEQEKIGEELFAHYLSSFEGNYVRDKCKYIIEKEENFSTLYASLNEEVHYNFLIKN